jgi:hypothetical protein
MATVPSLQLPGYAAPQTLDFSSLANLGQVYKKAETDANRQNVLSQLGQGGEIDPKLLIGSGDLTLANLGIQLQNKQQEQARQAQLDARQADRDKVTDQHWQASFGLQQEAAKRADADKYSVQAVKNPDGTTSLFKFNPRTGNVDPLQTGANPSAAPANPFAVGGKLSPDQAKSATMVDRMAQANDTITKNENINDGVTGYLGGTAAASPTVRDSSFFNYFASPARQATVQAQRNFVNAILRVESGAAISEGEFNNAQRQYFPQPGDSKEVIAQKQQNRITAMRGMAREAGPQYRPPAAVISPPSGPSAAPAASAQTAPPPPQRGQLVQGYRFKGGDPADQNNWVKAQ